MSKNPPDSPGTPPSRQAQTKPKKVKDREDALRMNLLKRKAQMRARSETPDPTTRTEKE